MVAQGSQRGDFGTHVPAPQRVDLLERHLRAGSYRTGESLGHQRFGCGFGKSARVDVGDHHVGDVPRSGGAAVVRCSIARSEQDLRGQPVLHKAVANLGGAGEIVGLHIYGSHIAPLALVVGSPPPRAGMHSSWHGCANHARGVAQFAQEWQSDGDNIRRSQSGKPSPFYREVNDDRSSSRK
ncbi:hypothetical protein D9M72_470900 [compost metagenome]